MIRLYLNGVLLPADQYEGIGDITVTITRKDSDGKRNVKRATGEIRFYGAAYDTLKAALITPLDGKLQFVKAVLVEVCEGDEVVLVDGAVKGSEIDWCEDECHITASIVEHTEDSKAVDCIKSTLVYDDHAGFLSADHPRVVYCDEIRPEWLHHVILISSTILLLLFDILLPVVLVVYVIVTVINAIIDAINFLGANIDPIDFDGDPNTDLIQEWTNLKNNLALTVIGCGRKHPSPLLREYIKNVCAKCGLQFVSSILNDAASDYFNTVYVNTPVKKGTRDNSLKYIWENRPVETLDTLLDDVKQVHNADWMVKNGQLLYEREDKLRGNGTWVVPADIKAQGRAEEGVCYEWDSDEPRAFASLSYTEDPMDEPGNEAKGFYSDIVEWNSPFSEMQRGEEQIILPFGMLRFRRDGIETDVLDAYRWYWNYTSAIDQHGNALLLSRGVAAYPKLLIWDGYDINFATVRQYAGKALPHNWPYQLNEDGVAANTGYEPDEPDMALYGRFHSIRNPRVTEGRGWKWRFQWTYLFSELQSMDLDALIPLSAGDGTIDEVTINPKDRTILATGTV